MKATGIIRRLDELGRIVIPKEIRKTLRINEGDSVEIFTDNEQSVIIKKYSPIDEFIPYAQEYANSLSTVSKAIVIITDKDQVVAATGSLKKDIMNKPISNNLLKIINERAMYVASNKSKIVDIVNMPNNNANIAKDNGISHQIIQPVISDGDAVGVVIMLLKEGLNVTEVEKKLINVAALFISNQIRG